MKLLTEDEVRDKAKVILKFENSENAVSGVGQITTFNQLGFLGVIDKPDGWYLPKLKTDIAIILETKAERVDIDSQYCIDELRKNCNIVLQQYKQVIGILYNGEKVRAFFNNSPIDVSKDLQEKSYYLNLINDKPLDKNKIYKLTADINNNLHYNFGIKDLYQRMVFTSCALVAQRYSSFALMENMNYDVLRNSISSNLNKSLQDSRNQNHKLEVIVDVFSEIKTNYPENQESVNKFINDVIKISKEVNSNHWRGEDVIGIFFNEFNRYKKKSESGQVFTPDHITNFMYRLLECNMNDKILDAAMGSGAFLIKAMSNQIEEAGGINTRKAKDIKENNLYGIEFDREIYALACANMLIHKDGKTNLELLDSRGYEAGSWISQKPITKVLMNPPFEQKYGCMDIVLNVLKNVKPGTMTAFILPEKKLDKSKKNDVKLLLENNRIKHIIKLPEKLFFEGVTTSIFVIEAGVPQNNRSIVAYNIEEDGLETVKNKGRHDIKNRWPEIENYWIEAILTGEDPKYNSKQILDPNQHLSWQAPKKEFVLYEEDFDKVLIDYIMNDNQIDFNDFSKKLFDRILYASDVSLEDEKLKIELEIGE
ncbi:HsdM family class I SAM-dependent methyltransferase [Mammaliicoccus sciuri]|uniref:HsdM family class I SAM-dependent methyltransferase n=1 Tax=Mammaliicoccus sciuri TaxID=1296 RepID=UPI000D1FA8E1|nr:N-6 DNA methylase [Mammaliicoccus sciuri]PTK05743.1 SAM-dependent methyltransferase [Mammaliicoccus sciuri]